MSFRHPGVIFFVILISSQHSTGIPSFSPHLDSSHHPSATLTFPMSIRHPGVILISSHHSVGILLFSPHLKVIPSYQCHSYLLNVSPSSMSHFDFIPSFRRHPVIFTSFRSHPIIPVPLLPSQCQSVIQESF